VHLDESGEQRLQQYPVANWKLVEAVVSVTVSAPGGTVGPVQGPAQLPALKQSTIDVLVAV
jgi:hypothetical protein